MILTRVSFFFSLIFDITIASSFINAFVLIPLPPVVKKYTSETYLSNSLENHHQKKYCCGWSPLLAPPSALPAKRCTRCYCQEKQVIDDGARCDHDQYSKLKFHKVHLRRQKTFASSSVDHNVDNYNSPWCYALTVDPTIECSDEDDNGDNQQMKDSLPSASIKYNFLASQVWPSARVAATLCESIFQSYHEKIQSSPSGSSSSRSICPIKVCELGCGPGLPSLAIANLRLGGIQIVATDIDELALYMVQKAAYKQGLIQYNGNSAMFQTKILDLTTPDENDMIDIIQNDINADIYIISDVFETNHVARGAAKFTMKALESKSQVWVFAQSDRVQREVYKDTLMQLIQEKEQQQRQHGEEWRNDYFEGELEWKIGGDINFNVGNDSTCRLILCDLDEVLVDYG